MNEKLQIIKSFFDTYKDFLVPLIFCIGIITLKRSLTYVIIVLKQLEVLLASVAPISVMLTCLYCLLLLYSRFGSHWT